MGNKDRLYIDFDGTIIDSKWRLYLLFQNLVPECNISFDFYWELKRQGISHRQILTKLFSYSETDCNEFENIWLTKIEDNFWLKYDKPFPGISNLLSSLSKVYDIFLVTSRQFQSGVFNQLNQYQLIEYFEEILVTGKSDKETLIKKSFQSGSNWMIGDTGYDIKLGKVFNMHTVAVLSGFRDEKYLLGFSPDYIIENVTQLFEILPNQGK